MIVVALDDARAIGAPDAESFFLGLERVKVLSSKSPCYVVLDLTGAAPDAQRRQRLVTWLRSHGSTLRAQVVAIAIVAPSTFLRGALTAVRWFMTDRVMVSEVFETRLEALRWIELQQRRR